MPGNLLSLLVCPLTKQHLLPLGEHKTRLLQEALSDSLLHYVDGTPVIAKADQIQFLITENQHHIYSVIDKVPVLLESRQIGPLDL